MTRTKNMTPHETHNVTPRRYKEPQQLLVPCPTCGLTVLHGVSKEGGKITKLTKPLSPVLGVVHVCRKEEVA